MRIAVIQHVDSGDYSAYLSDLLNEEAKEKGYQIKIWNSSIPAFQQQIAENSIVYIIIESNAQWKLKWWYKIRIPVILKKMNVTVMLDLNSIISGTVKHPQIISISSLLFSTAKRNASAICKYAFNQIARSVSLANHCIIYSNNIADILFRQTNAQSNIQALYFSAPAVFRTFEWHEKIMVKAQQADNKEYFIAVLNDDAAESFILVLRAFSKFKKWQQSSMQFLILPEHELFDENIHQKLKTYKHRDDVRLLEKLAETQIAPILASAYAYIHVSLEQPNLLALSAALQCSVPVIAQEDADTKEYAGDAALYAADKSFEALGDMLIKIYKDENLHLQLKEACGSKIIMLNRNACKYKLWNLLETAAHS